MSNERNVAREEATVALQWKPTAEARWQNIAEMRDMLIQLRVALHVSKREERRMDKSTRDALRRAEKLQLELNKSLSSVQRSTVGGRKKKSRGGGGGGGGGGGQRSGSGRRRMPPSPAMLPSANQRQRFAASRGAMTSAGSSIMGLTPPGSPEGGYYNNNSSGYDEQEQYDEQYDEQQPASIPLRATTPGMGYRMLPEVAPPGTPLYYSPVRDQNGRAVSPVHPSRRTPSKKERSVHVIGGSAKRWGGKTRAASPIANARYTNDTVLDAEWKGWPKQNKKNKRVESKNGGVMVSFE